MMVKRLPKSKSGRLLVAIRNRMLGDPLVTPDKVKKVEKLNQRIQNRLVSEDQRNHVQCMFTDYRIVFEYEHFGAVYRAKFTGTFTEAQKTLNAQTRHEAIRGPLPVIQWSHFTKGNEMLMSGMFLEITTIKTFK